MGSIASTFALPIEIGGIPILVRTDSPEFAEILEQRYGGYINFSAQPLFTFDVEIVEPSTGADADAAATVRYEEGRWIIERGDFYAEWNPQAKHGCIRQALYPYAIDAALRILHSLLLASQGGLLMHAASAVRNGRAFLFAGVSEAGKTTMSRLAPPDATLLTDEISYLRPNSDGTGYLAYGTPFAGELAEPGANIRAPLAGIFLLGKGPENRIEPVGEGEAARAVLANILFFAHDAELVGKVFDTACRVARTVPVQRLTFFPDARVWGLIQ